MKEYGENYSSMVPYFPHRDRKAIQFRCYQLDTKDQASGKRKHIMFSHQKANSPMQQISSKRANGQMMK